MSEARRKGGKLWAWDLETYDWDKPLCAAAVSEDGDEIMHWGPDCLQKLADDMDRIRGTWGAHAGGIFDTPLMLNVDTFASMIKRLIVTGSTVLCADGSRLKVRDTYPATLAPLAKLGQWVGLPKLDLDRSRLEQATRKETETYCLRDCEILLAAMQAFLAYQEEQGARRAWTAGSAAVNLLQAIEPGSWSCLRRHRLDAETAMAAAQSVAGGRVECWAKGRVPRVWSYDFKSSYPARYGRGQLLGVGCRPARPGDHTAVWRARWQWPDRRLIPPVLDAWTKAGAGWCEAWIIPEELLALREQGCAVYLLEGWAAESVEHIGSAFVSELFAQKSAGVPWAKVYVNSLHGKFSEQLLKDQWTADYPTDYWAEVPPTRHGRWWHSMHIATQKDGKAAPHVQPIAAAQILGRARVALWQVLSTVQNAGYEVYYCDTDSIHCSCPPDRFPVPLGGELGDLELESGEEACEGIYLGPKAYLLLRDGEIVKSALKGVPLKAYAEGEMFDRPPDEKSPFGSTLIKEASRLDRAQDLRVELFERALHPTRKVYAAKGGITSFVKGAKRDDHFRREKLERNIRPTMRGKGWGPGPTDYFYKTPREVAEKS